MKYLVSTFLLFISFGVFAQKPDSIGLVKSIADLNYALLNKDTIKLGFLLRDDLHYYHSNGWLELKQDVVNDLYNGKLNYTKISNQLLSVRFPGIDVAQARMISDINVDYKGRPIQIKLSVVQVWVWKNKHWILYSRHSVKIK